MDTAELAWHVLKQSRVGPWGDHGILHWARVLENGELLAEETGANLEVVTLFALLHDARRFREDEDPEHGPRAAAYCVSLRGSLIHLSDDDFSLLFQACKLHTVARSSPNVTIQACFDADRLDLGRAGIRPDPRRLGSEAARDLAHWAYLRALHGEEPELVAQPHPGWHMTEERVKALREGAGTSGAQRGKG